MQRAIFRLWLALCIAATLGPGASTATARGRAWKPAFAPPDDNLQRLHRNLSEDHRATIEHAEALKSELASQGWSFDQGAVRAHLSRMGDSLEAARRDHEALKHAGASDWFSKLHHEAIAAHHAAAWQSYNALEEQLQSDSVNPSLAFDQADAVSNEIRAAEHEHLALWRPHIAARSVLPSGKAYAGHATEESLAVPSR